jgi:outer membrane protein, heavy metal efflux system
MSPRSRALRGAEVGALLLSLAACSGPRPEGELAERRRSEEAGRAFETPHERRELPPLATRPALEDVLRYAFLSNADLERAWFEWRMALERIPQVTSLDDPRFSFEYMFSKDMMSRWDRTTLGLSQMVPFPGKLELAGRIALQAAIAAGHRFEDAKFSLQASVVSAWQDLAWVDRKIAIAERNLALLRDFADLTRSRIAVGKAAQSDASKIDLELGMAQNELATMRAERAPMLAMVNALLSRKSDAAIETRDGDAAAVAPPDDASLLALAAERNPELQALAAEVKGREDAWELARKAWLPDFELSLSIQGSVERVLMGALNVPLRVDRIQAGIAEAQAGTRAAQAALRARGDDLRARVVLQIFLARNGERQAGLLADSLLPRAGEIVEAVRAGYATGGASFLDLLDAQRSLLELESMRADVAAGRAKAVAALEAICALDFGTLPHDPAGER